MKMLPRIIIILLMLFAVSIHANKQQVTDAVVKVYASISVPNYQYPWQSPQRQQVSGSGVVIKDNYIITSAHVVANGTYIQVSKDKEVKKYVAKLEYISHQADLALLKVEDKDFYKNITHLELTEDVATGDSVTVLGYPLGGSSLSTTQGVISRIESHSYVWSYERMLTIQIDAAINPGNSGGAAVDPLYKLVGIVMQSYSKQVSENIGYIVPAQIINTFLEDIKDGKVDGFDNRKNFFQATDNPTFREYYNLSPDQGVVFNTIDDEDKQLKPRDILLELSGEKVSQYGLVKTQYGNQVVDYLIHRKPVGESLACKIRRDGNEIDFAYTLKRHHDVIPYEYDKSPRYMVFAGLVFSPITKNYLALKQLTPIYTSFFTYNPKVKGINEAVQVQYEKFPHTINEGYIPNSYVVYKVNGAKVTDFNHFVKLIDESNEKYTVIEFLDVDFKYIFNTKEAKKSFKEIQATYGIEKDRRL